MKIYHFGVIPWPKNSYGKTIFLMKLSFFFYLLFCFQLLAFNGFSQKNVTLEEQNSSLKSIIHKIEEQTSYSFILNNDVIDVDQKFSITVIKKDVTETLEQLFKNATISYKIKKKHIILSKAKRKDDHFTISGIVTDASTGEILLGASIIIKNTTKGVFTNTYGFYSITLPKGDYIFEVTHLGYATKEIKVQLQRNLSLKIALIPSSSELDEIVIQSNQNSKSQVTRVLGGTTSLTASEIKKTPALLGEPDINRAILTQPGISSVGEGTSGFNVRGGNVDQNLVLIDEAPLYNTSHLFGLFSIFNADAIKTSTLYKGEIPAQFGGRASSLLDIRQKNGNSKRLKGEGGLGLLFSKFTIEAPIKKDKLSFLASGRRSYFDLFFPLFKDIRFTKFHFYDLNTKVSWDVNKNNKIYASGFFGADVIQFKQDDVDDQNITADLGWTNTTATLRWNHIFSNKLFTNITGIYSRYKYSLGAREEAVEEDIEGILNRSIENWIFKPDFTYYSSPTTKMRFGLYGNLYQFIPKLSGNAIQQSIDKEKALELAAYYSIHKQWDKLSLQAGLRASWFGNFGPERVAIYDPNFPQTPSTITGFRNVKKNEVSKSFLGLEPRLALKYDVNDCKALKIGYNRMFQYIHLISNQTVALPNDLWKPFGVHIEPLEVNQWSAGYAYDTKDQNYNFSAEGYYKHFDNIVEYKNGANIGLIDPGLNENIETELVSAEGFSYGLELAAYKNKGKLTGNVNYTYSVSKRKTKSDFSSEQINNNNYFPSNFDRPHIFNITANYKLSKKWEAGAFFTYQTGRPNTQPNGRIRFEGVSFLTYADRNAFRIPNTHRADISFTYTPTGNPKTNWAGSWSFGVYNVYGRKNAFSINTIFEDNKVETGQFSLIGAPIPFISYNFKF
ncbi:TonB-dependent receptor [Aquimarina sp. MMG016]|uniref:TonB-dependent receptor n=1 Tax=Aquimarina sp. MMG016 TaxID=2822690 RepID=UPI001B3A16BA|nr:TonB-dependent receptor [Aquimarina sp. MMG016]MBQ4820747.1 TonB-dependent receptor [Aquimarina sp. MMG016]